MPHLYDISPVLSPRIAVFPQDTAFSRTVLMHVDQGHHITLSSVASTVHVGSHVDAPVHYGRGGRTMEEQPLELYLGPCLMVRAPGTRGRRVTVADVAGRVPFGTQRVLLATDSYPDPEQWNSDFAGVEPELVAWLDARGVRLVGVDTPSVDTADSKDLPAHAAFFAHDMAILEGLVLRGVPEGRYELIALPLRLEGADASPVRAVLRAP